MKSKKKGCREITLPHPWRRITQAVMDASTGRFEQASCATRLSPFCSNRHVLYFHSEPYLRHPSPSARYMKILFLGRPASEATPEAVLPLRYSTATSLPEFIPTRLPGPAEPAGAEPSLDRKGRGEGAWFPLRPFSFPAPGRAVSAERLPPASRGLSTG